MAFNGGVHRSVFYDPVISTGQNGERRELTGLYSYFGGRGAYWRFKPFETFMFDDQNQIISDESGEGIKIQKPFIYTSAAFEGQTRVQIDEINRFRGIDGSAEITGDDWRHWLSVLQMLHRLSSFYNTDSADRTPQHRPFQSDA